MATRPDLTEDCPLCKAHMQLQFRDMVLMPKDLRPASNPDTKQAVSAKLYECKSCGFIVLKSR